MGLNVLKDYVAGGAMNADLLLKDGIVITMDSKRRVLERGYIAVRSSKITAIGPGDPPMDLVADKVLDCSATIVLPGLVNVHDHLDQTLYRGMIDDMHPALLPIS